VLFSEVAVRDDVELRLLADDAFVGVGGVLTVPVGESSSSKEALLLLASRMVLGDGVFLSVCGATGTTSISPFLTRGVSCSSIVC